MGDKGDKRDKGAKNYSREGKGFRELPVWQRAHELTLAIYELTTDCSRQKYFGWRVCAAGGEIRKLKNSGAGQMCFKGKQA